MFHIKFPWSFVYKINCCNDCIPFLKIIGQLKKYFSSYSKQLFLCLFWMLNSLPIFLERVQIWKSIRWIVVHLFSRFCCQLNQQEFIWPEILLDGQMLPNYLFIINKPKTISEVIFLKTYHGDMGMA